MIGYLFDAVIDALTRRWEAKHAPRSKRAFRCECGAPVFFRNSQSLNCHAPLGYAPIRGDLSALESGNAPETWRIVGDDNDQAYRRCGNFQTAAGCNWLVPADEPETLCLSCRLSRSVPDLADEDNQRYWRILESGKRRLISQLLALGLPVVSKASDPERGLAFDLLRSPASGPRLLTGHANGLITLTVEEADDAIRERILTELHEPYRTLLGHLRHEIGHYYWDRLVWDSAWLNPFRALFGDERADYGEAIKANYEKGPPADWSNQYISSYASAHPWEDWAETWAHYLHIVDSLDTAMAHGLDADDLELDIEPFPSDDLFDPQDPNAERFLFLLNS